MSSPEASRRVASALALAVQRYGWGGIVVDFEEIPNDVHPSFISFLEILRAELNSHSIGVSGQRPLLVQTLGDGTAPHDLRAYSAITDYTILMLYDEHYGAGDVGPVASNAWYENAARRAVAAVPPKKLMLAIGAYGYDWNDGEKGGPGAVNDVPGCNDCVTQIGQSPHL